MALIFSKEEAKKLLGEYKEYDADYGKVINEKGVSPDYRVKGKEKQLEKAIELLK